MSAKSLAVAPPATTRLSPVEISSCWTVSVLVLVPVPVPVSVPVLVSVDVVPVLLFDCPPDDLQAVSANSKATSATDVVGLITITFSLKFPYFF